MHTDSDDSFYRKKPFDFSNCLCRRRFSGYSRANGYAYMEYYHGDGGGDSDNEKNENVVQFEYTKSIDEMNDEMKWTRSHTVAAPLDK